MQVLCHYFDRTLHIKQRVDVQAPRNELVEDHHPHTGFLGCTDGQYAAYIVCSITADSKPTMVWFRLSPGHSGKFNILSFDLRSV